MLWTIQRNGRTFGPYDAAQLRRFAEQGIIAAETILVADDDRRTTAGRVAGFKFGAFLDVDPPPPLTAETYANVAAPSKAEATPMPSRPSLYSRAQWIAIVVGMLLFRNRGCRPNGQNSGNSPPKADASPPRGAR